MAALFLFPIFCCTFAVLFKKAMTKAFAEDGIDIGKLTDGVHQYSWVLGADFFGAFEGSLISDGVLEARLVLERVENVFRANLQTKGQAYLPCDNCLEQVSIPFEGELDFVVKISDSREEDDSDNEVFYVTESDPRFYVAQHIYDLVNLGLPLRRTCEAPGETPACNIDMLKRMDPEQEKEEGEGNDPRWDKLKDLFN